MYQKASHWRIRFGFMGEEVVESYGPLTQTTAPTGGERGAIVCSSPEYAVDWMAGWLVYMWMVVLTCGHFSS